MMLALFLRVRLLNLPQLKRNTTAERWAEAGVDLARIRRLVGINLLIGLAVVTLAAARPMF